MGSQGEVRGSFIGNKARDSSYTVNEWWGAWGVNGKIGLTTRDTAADYFLAGHLEVEEGSGQQQRTQPQITEWRIRERIGKTQIIIITLISHLYNNQYNYMIFAADIEARQLCL